jgi:hypothetical protein
MTGETRRQATVRWTKLVQESRGMSTGSICRASSSWVGGVRYQRGRKIVSRYFPDSAHGGRDEAHAAALRFASEREQDGGELLALLRRLSPRKTSRFGFPGVARLVRHPPDRGTYWVAYWNDATGHKVQKKFSVSIYGEDMARELAIEARQNATKAHRKRLAELIRPPGRSSTARAARPRPPARRRAPPRGRDGRGCRTSGLPLPALTPRAVAEPCARRGRACRDGPRP